MWLWLGGVSIVAFAILGLIGREIYFQAPPEPEKVVAASGVTIIVFSIGAVTLALFAMSLLIAGRRGHIGSEPIFVPGE